MFWFFWTAYSIAVALAVYDLAALGFCLQWRDLGAPTP
jgi:hypothetical protein